MDQTKEIDIDLKKIFFMMRKKVVYILLFTLLGALPPVALPSSLSTKSTPPKSPCTCTVIWIS